MRLATPGTPGVALAALLLSACAGSGAAPPPPDPCDWPMEGSTATASVSILQCDYAMPQLERERRVWIYLPPDYHDGSKRYPVLYMHDGQNVFDAATSYAGEWGVDEALDSLHAAGDPGVIVVAVDNGGERRMDEYSPQRNRIRRFGGEGDAYVRFLVETLKPHIDSAYRTLPGREHTGIAGSSMGGLISLHALLEHPDVFGRAGVFSPSFSIVPALFDSAAAAPPLPSGTRVYMVTGGNEGDDPEAYTRGHERMAAILDELTTAPGAEHHSFIRPGGIHNERFWRDEFPAAYRWLFATDTPAARARP